MYRSVLVPVDFSPPSLQALTIGSDLVRALGGRLALLHVQEDGAERAVSTAARLARLEEWARLARRPPRLLLDLCPPGGVADAILARARSERPDLLVLGASGWGGGDRLGRVAAAVVPRSSVPVQLVPAALESARVVFDTWPAFTERG